MSTDQNSFLHVCRSPPLDPHVRRLHEEINALTLAHLLATLPANHVLECPLDVLFSEASFKARLPSTLLSMYSPPLTPILMIFPDERSHRSDPEVHKYLQRLSELSADDLSLLSWVGLRATLNFHNVQYEDSAHKATVYTHQARHHLRIANNAHELLQTRMPVDEDDDIEAAIQCRNQGS